jgi:hypothetical protein
MKHDELVKRVNAIKCDKCGKMHDPYDTTCLVVYGNICFGTRGGVIGGNFDETTGLLKRANVYCYPDCFYKMFLMEGEK